ncbi:MAG: hypothetical protein RR620_13305 [Clostridium sp.]
MGYLKMLTNEEFIILDTDGLYTDTITLSEEIMNEYKKGIESGKVYKILDHSGKTFEEIFGEVEQTEQIQEPTQEERIRALEETMLAML